MALILKNGIFYHIPKTGGVWVGEALRRAHLVQEEYTEKKHPMGVLNLTLEHISPTYADSGVVGGKRSFAFVRNPITWYQSFWKYKKANNGWDEPYVGYKDELFNGFMRKIMDLAPGFLTQIYKEFDGVTYMGKQENLRNDLISVLEVLGESFDSDVIDEVPVTNESPLANPGLGFCCDYEPEILEEMKEKERWIFEKYYPEEL